MSVLVMDGGHHLKRSWRPDADHTPSSSDTMLPDAQAPPSSSNPLPTPYPTASEHKLPPISTTFDRQVHARRDIPSPLLAWTSRQASPLPSPDDRPGKRPRWDHSHEPSTAHSSRLGYPGSTPSSSHISPVSTFGRNPESEASRENEGCQNCANTQDLVAQVVSGLLNLDTEIRKALSMTVAPQAPPREATSEVTTRGLRESLVWASNSISASALMVREVAAFPRGYATSIPGVANMDRPVHSTDHFRIPSAPSDHSNRTVEHYDKDRGDEAPAGRREISSTTVEASMRPSDLLPPISTMDSMMKKGHPYDPSLSIPAQSPHRSSPGSAFGSAQSPIQSQHSTRTLPSPSTFQYPTPSSGAPPTYSPSQNQAAQTAHLQDLQHQISTKTLALQTLQREHDQLLAALSRSQVRCTALDRKSQVSDREINTLSEEKFHLQQQVEALEVQVEELVKARDEAQKQSAADGAQWRQIMSMSSQLQAKGSDDTRRYKTEREHWERDRAGLQQRIQELESGQLTLVASVGSIASGQSISPDDILTSASLDVLREEIVRLRRSCAEMEAVLQDIMSESSQMDDTMGAFASIRDRIRAKARQGLHEHE